MKANYSPERRTRALSWIRGEGLLDDTSLSDDARLLAAVGLVICDENGRIKASELDIAMADPSVVNYARNLLQDARERSE